jgi:hypothetical protein
MRTLVLLVSLASVVTFGHSSAPASGRSVGPTADGSLRVAVQPAVVRLHQQATVAVSGVHAGSIQVRLSGAAYADGTPLPWRSLRLVGGAWRGSLPAPALPGVYAVLLRTGAGAQTLGQRHGFLRVFARGTRARPSFDEPADVVRWWVRAIPHGTLVAFKAWPRPAFDRRDPRLHRLFVVAYSPPGHPLVGDRLGMFVTAFRNGYHGRWRLLEATVEP